MSENRILKGTLILTCAGFLSRFLGFFYRIFLSHTIGAKGLGIFQLVMPLQVLAMALSSSGVQTAISRLSASSSALGQDKKAKDYLVLGALFSVTAALLLSRMMFSHSLFFAEQILKEPLTEPLVRILALSLPLSALHNCISSYYFSLKRTGIPAGIQLGEQLVRVGSTYLIYLIFLSEHREITPVIALYGALASEMCAAFLSLFAIGMHFHQSRYSLRKLRCPSEMLRSILRLSLPLTLNRVLLTVLNSMEVILIPQRLRMSGLTPEDTLCVYGVFTGMAMPLILFPSTIANSAAVMLMPSVAELQALGEKKKIRGIIRRILKYCLLLGGGCTLFFLLFGQFLGNFLFHSPTAGTYVRTLALICPFLYLNTTFTSVLQGLGRTGTCLLHSVVSVSLRVFFVVCAIPALGIRGYLYGILLAEFLLTLMHLNVLFRSENL